MAATLLLSGAQIMGHLALGISVYADRAPLTVRLYTNNHVPDWLDDDSNYTECSLAGYAAEDTDPANWTEASGSDFQDFSYPTINFTFSAYAGPTVMIFGYFIQDATDAVWWAEKFDTPYAVPLAGGSATLDVKLRTHQC